MSAPLDHYGLWLSLLSPVHIGCGEDYTDTEYYVDSGRLHAFDLARLAGSAWLAPLGDKALRIGSGADAVSVRRELRAALAGHRREIAHAVHRTVPVAAGIEDLYRAVVGGRAAVPQQPDVTNQLEIARTAYTGEDQTAYIPASSFKGSMRTAVLDSIRARAGAA